jgi:hypothetical protein
MDNAANPKFTARNLIEFLQQLFKTKAISPSKCCQEGFDPSDPSEENPKQFSSCYDMTISPTPYSTTEEDPPSSSSSSSGDED